MSGTRVRGVFLVAALVVVLVGLGTACGGDEDAGISGELVGTYEIVDPQNPNPMPFQLGLHRKAGDPCTWLTENERDCYTIAHKHPDAPFEFGAISVEGDEITFEAKPGGIGECVKGDPTRPAMYRWSLSGGKLTLTVVRDECVGRAELFALGPWAKRS